tara:strand:+ start:300 stop:983 length:684 start_codon:yes stop_codon:yes gene_type:complete
VRSKGRKISSTQWLRRQLNDPYVAEAKRLGYRSRAAFKLTELDDQFHFLKPGGKIIDIGAAPGGWTQVAVTRTNSDASAKGPIGKVVSIDLLDMEPIHGAHLITNDFLDEKSPDLLKRSLGGKANVVLSDIAAPTTGHKYTDHIRIMILLEATLEFAYQVLAPKGVFIGKVFKGGTEQALLSGMQKNFFSVRHAKPPASRDKSAEAYVIGIGFREYYKSLNHQDHIT